ncbi:DUF2288 domain-containing protein [filamentous cyanobacterium CCP5]|nr:DUF2288 domain-containing protein [filamentous cyanobacterium CCP5]
MEQDLRLELAEMVEPAEWSWLSPHATRDALVVVDKQLDLVDVGYAIATDDVTKVNRWISEALLAKPTAQQMASWIEAERKRFKALIVQPYVLVQDSVTP